MDVNNLYREEVFTDRHVGTIRVLTPVTAEIVLDQTRTTIYVGETQVLTQAGLLPLVFEIPATSLQQAIAAFGDAVETAVRQAEDELRELRRRASSSLIVPADVPTDVLTRPANPPRGFGPGR